MVQVAFYPFLNFPLPRLQRGLSAPAVLHMVRPAGTHGVSSLTLAAVTLDDKYAQTKGRVFLTGTQALVRLPMMQRQRDYAAGINTACYISGYRGSPMGGLDTQLWQAAPFLQRNHIQFHPGINEDLAATAIWGSQQLGLFPGAQYDGVFAMWYGKGPGVDRSGDVFKHGNLAGSSRYGGVLLAIGDDHTCKSSTTAHQSELAMVDASIPVLNPAGVQEFLDFGLYGWAMSRYSGCWVGFKTTSESVDSSASVYVDPERAPIILPDDFEMPDGKLNIRWPDPPLDQEYRLHRHKLYAAMHFARVNRLDKIAIDSPRRRFGIITTGKSYLDVRQALDDLGINAALAASIGLVVYKVAMPWPLEPEGIRSLAEGLEEILVVEEKRAIIENQIKEQLYNWRADLRPRVVGKFREDGEWILPSTGELSPARIARIIASRIQLFHNSEAIKHRLTLLEEREESPRHQSANFQRAPFFCSGCPHNVSTRVPKGSRVLAGIGCHYMAIWMDRSTNTFTHMGAEGVNWIGQAPFTDEKHVFVNLGDGTYYHSGILAVRQAVAAGVNVTFKILYNDAVAMTGGQPIDGPLSVDRVSRQLAAEGVDCIFVVTDEPHKYPSGTNFAPGTKVHHRDELDRLQRDLRNHKGVSALIYDQTCAAEKRRRRKRGLYPDPAKRVVINEAVCEGCGDCSVASNCLSVVPVETEFGRKRTIDQSSCNKDYSCLNGFCPSFVTVHGGELRKPSTADFDSSAGEFSAKLPTPQLPILDQPYSILITGIGGTGVVTIGALLAMAAHMEGKACSVLDITGLAQKGGAVTSHLRIGQAPEDLHATRIATGGAHVMLGCDLVVAAASESLTKVRAGITRAVINSYEAITGDFTRNPDLRIPSAEMGKAIVDAVGANAVKFIDASRLATALMGDTLATNMFLVGFAWQQGLIPLNAQAIEQAITLNGVAVTMNKRAFLWGRRAAVMPRAVAELVEPRVPAEPNIATSLDDIIRRRAHVLTEYQRQATANRFTEFVARVEAAERKLGHRGMAEIVANAYFKLIAYKDEYEVARLYTNGEFQARIAQQFTGNYKLHFHLAPPLVSKRDPHTGNLRKSVYGSWMMLTFALLAKLKWLRGTPLDPFGYSAERRLERKLITEYELVMSEVLENLTTDNHALACEIASVPEHMRGFGHVKKGNIEIAKAHEEVLLTAFRRCEPWPKDRLIATKAAE